MKSPHMRSSYLLETAKQDLAIVALAHRPGAGQISARLAPRGRSLGEPRGDVAQHATARPIQLGREQVQLGGSRAR
jgi:hypothetical protein